MITDLTGDILSTDLGHTVDLLADNRFTARVKAAATEHARTAIASPPSAWRDRMASDRLAMNVVYDAAQPSAVLARLVADDATVSGFATPADVPDGEIRRVIAAQWLAVASSMPGI